ncbi:MAG: MamI family restriction endonuclease [Oscillospiraceae bacterium]
MYNYQLGTKEASEQLIRDLYIDLKNKVNEWSKITKQTPQARMGYIGQHLVSVVTGYPGSKTGARGPDLLLGNDEYGEIKTCYRVDQLGKCANCGNVVSSMENICTHCKSTNIIRKDDSKWLIEIRNDVEFEKILEPKFYYFVLFEIEKLNNENKIVASIWEVNPKNRGFAFCMMDYYYNIRAKSSSKAPFNMWPYNLKFTLTQPKLIYRSLIYDDGKIETTIFPGDGKEHVDVLKPLNSYSGATTLKIKTIENIILKLDSHFKPREKTKEKLLTDLETIRNSQNIENATLCDLFSEEIYLCLLKEHIALMPCELKKHYPDLI